jgi:hypothetical protein
MLWSSGRSEIKKRWEKEENRRVEKIKGCGGREVILQQQKKGQLELKMIGE